MCIRDRGKEDLAALSRGIVNLEKHIENLQKYGVPVIVTLNSFLTDTEAEYQYVKKFCQEPDCEFALSEVWAKEMCIRDSSYSLICLFYRKSY